MEADVGRRTSISTICMVKERSRRALWGVVELDKDEIEVGFLNCVCQMDVGDNTLGGAGDVVGLLLESVEAPQGIDHGRIAPTKGRRIRHGGKGSLDIKVKSINNRIAKRTRPSVSRILRTECIP